MAPTRQPRPGKHATAKSCVFIKQLSNLDHEVPDRLIRASWAGAAPL